MAGELCYFCLGSAHDVVIMIVVQLPKQLFVRGHLFLPPVHNSALLCRPTRNEFELVLRAHTCRRRPRSMSA